MAFNTQNIVFGFVIFITLVGLTAEIYGDFKTGYDLNPTHTIDADGDGDDEDIITALQQLDILESLNKIKTGLINIVSPSKFEDIIGGLLNVGIGALKGFSVDLIRFPGQIIGVLVQYYTGIPSVIITMIELLSAFSIGFIILKKFTGSD